jgi:hypothetical protein
MALTMSALGACPRRSDHVDHADMCVSGALVPSPRLRPPGPSNGQGRIPERVDPGREAGYWTPHVFPTRSEPRQKAPGRRPAACTDSMWVSDRSHQQDPSRAEQHRGIHW